MGGLVSRWRQAKPLTVEVLEKIDKEIQALEEFREKNQRLQKLWVGRLLLYSSILYLITCLIVYLWYLPDEWTARLIMMLPFFAFPLMYEWQAAASMYSLSVKRWTYVECLVPSRTNSRDSSSLSKLENVCLPQPAVTH